MVHPPAVIPPRSRWAWPLWPVSPLASPRSNPSPPSGDFCNVHDPAIAANRLSWSVRWILCEVDTVRWIVAQPTLEATVLKPPSFALLPRAHDSLLRELSQAAVAMLNSPPPC